MKAMKGQVQGTVNVDMNAAPGIDLQKVIGDLRNEYESLIGKNQKEIESWFHTQVSCDPYRTCIPYRLYV